ncbi:hypothetical protein OHS58_04945 [Amycolatopsis sp. NBC_00348]|uniref:hypothetical protein n=1 Tax=Amycolatopsis sp. NBC_00348 TaxID=2975956 RepID=UPI002E252760
MVTGGSFLNGPEPPSRGVGFVAACWVLVLAGLLFALLFGAAGAMSSDSCRPDEVTFVCSPSGQGVLFWLPLAGWLVSIVVAWGTVVKLDRTPWLGLAAGVVLYAVVIGVEWLVVTG